jgi:hypothetical protein
LKAKIWEAISPEMSKDVCTFIETELKFTMYNNAAGKWQVSGCIQKFPDWPPGARNENDRALCH